MSKIMYNDTEYTGGGGGSGSIDYVDENFGIQDTPVGHILAVMANSVPKHYLKCDGAIYNIGEYPYLEQHFIDEFGKVDYFGGNGTTTFAVPDLRELVLVGAEQNGKYSIAAHDVYTVGQFKDDQLQSHNHNYNSLTAVVGAGHTVGTYGNVFGTLITNVNTGRSGTTTHGKQIGILYCIKCEPTYYVSVGGGEGDGTPIGSIIANISDIPPVGYVLCDGRSLDRQEYSKLFKAIGTKYGSDSDDTFNVPDLRELGLVGAGQNETNSITAHDVYDVGEFKDDQLQSHVHTYATLTSAIGQGYAGASSGSVFTNQSTNINNGRTGTTTHGKQFGVNYYVKAI